LDELDALIAEARAARTGSPDDIRAAVHARAQVDGDAELADLEEKLARHGAAGTSADGAPADGPDGPDDGGPRFRDAPEPRQVRPGREAQRLYRELARHAHPDLVQDEARKERRSAFIARVNDAYARGD